MINEHLECGRVVRQMQGRVFKRMQTRSTPLYKQIADRLLVDIRNGILPVGTLLPGEMELRRTYGTSRHTVREALRVLEYMGVVKRERGRGTGISVGGAPPAGARGTGCGGAGGVCGRVG